MYTINICYFKRDFHHVVFKHVYTNMCFISKIDNVFELCYIEKGDVIRVKSNDIKELIIKGKEYLLNYFNAKINFIELRKDEELRKYNYIN